MFRDDAELPESAGQVQRGHPFEPFDSSEDVFGVWQHGVDWFGFAVERPVVDTQSPASSVWLFDDDDWRVECRVGVPDDSGPQHLVDGVLEPRRMPERLLGLGSGDHWMIVCQLDGHRREQGRSRDGFKNISKLHDKIAVSLSHAG